MREFTSLSILDKFRGILERFGCDYPLLREILKVKLTMDARRVPTIVSNARKKQSDSDKNSFVRSLWMYALMGLILLPFVLMNDNYLFQMSIAFAILMFLVMTSMISDFSSVLLDVRDRTIIATKPVPPRTLSFARAIHITIYLSLLTGTLAGPGLIGALLRHGIGFFLLFLVAVILLDIFVLVVTALLYLLVMNVFDGERLKDMINYVQIALSIVMLVGYQLVGRSFNILQVHIAFHAAWWQIFVPPFWFGAVFTWLQAGSSGVEITILSIFAVVVPCALFALYVRLMPAFERKLEKLAEDAQQKKQRAKSAVSWMSRLVCRTEEERAFFQFSSWMMAKEREFKLKVYPSLGLSIVFPFLFMFNPAFSGGQHSLSSGKGYLFIYTAGLMVPSVVSMLKHSSRYKASWIYEVAPVTHRSLVYRGTMKAFLVRLFLPVFLVESIVFAIIFGWPVILQLVAVGLSMLVYAVICFWMLDKDLPFSRPFEVVPSGKRYLVFVLILVLAVFALVHFAFTLVPFGIYIYLALLIVLNAVAWTFGFRLPQISASK